MMKYAIVSITLLSACAQAANPALIKDRPVVFIPDASYFYCPTVDQYPSVKTLTDIQVAELLVQLDTYNRECKASLDAVLAQLLATKTQLEGGK